MSFDPVVLFFVLGMVAGLARSDLKLPPAIYDFVSAVLLLSLGMKGGVELAKHPLLPMLAPIAVVILMGALLTLVSFAALRWLVRVPRVDAAAIAAHYGSVSVATFAVAVAYLAAREIAYEAELSIYLVVLEMPGIVIGILIARGLDANVPWRRVLHEVFFGRSIVLLAGGLLIGWVSGGDALQGIGPLFFDLFKGFLAIFLLDMGLIAAAQLGGFRRQGGGLVLFAVVAPLAFALIGAFVARFLGLSLGGTALLATLAASASYIAAPAALRSAVPSANPGMSLTMVLAITFPFNIIIGIPLYFELARRMAG